MTHAATLPDHNAAISQNMQGTIDNIRKKTDIRTLNFSDCPLNDAAASALADVIRNESRFYMVHFTRCNLSDTGMATLIDALATCSGIQSISIDGNRAFGEKSAAALARLFNHHTRVETVDARNNGITPDLLAPILKTLPRCKTLANFSAATYQENAYDQNQALVNAVVDLNASPNLCWMMPKPTHQNDLIRERMKRLNTLRDRMDKHQDDYSAMSASATAWALTTLPSLKRIYLSHIHDGFLKKFEDYTTHLPELDFTRPIGMAELTRLNANGLCPLDNPRTWMFFDRVLEQENHGIDLGLLHKKNAKGESYLAIGMASAPEIILPLMQHLGIKLTPQNLFENDKPSALLDALILRDKCAEIFTPQNFSGQSRYALLRIHSRLPPEEQNKVIDFQGILNELNAESQRGKGR